LSFGDCHLMTSVPSPEFLPVTFALFEQLYADENCKDVELVASDGSLWAHSLILSACAAPLAAMMRGGMAEGRNRRIEMPDFTVTELNFIMRLLHTGGMDPAEWPDFKLLVDVTAIYAHEPCTVRFRILSTRPYGKMMLAWSRNQDMPLTQVDFLVKGHKLKPTDTLASTGFMDSDVEAAPAESGQVCESEGQILRPPLGLLYASASFGKRYGMELFLSTIIDQLKARICEKDFEAVLALAIQVDLTPLKMACLLFARGNSRIRVMFDQQEFGPLVQFELQAIWSAVLERKRKFSKILSNTSASLDL